MKTLVLLSALALLVFQVQADTIQNTDEGTKTEEQPGEEDQAVSDSFGSPEDCALQDAARRRSLLCPQCPRCQSCPLCWRCLRCNCNPK
ncbi:alpha-defensin-related sequence 12-like [Mus caroli]|uniref:Alpha-defensin-related sequence 12-like n=1 Tax=Mus caroli TaxID=10089 RepID=A0A6P5Q893_MUSCR|nr:alpha-defensin-related sequence 12-like [Mus caroli]